MDGTALGEDRHHPLAKRRLSTSDLIQSEKSGRIGRCTCCIHIKFPGVDNIRDWRKRGISIVPGLPPGGLRHGIWGRINKWVPWCPVCNQFAQQSCSAHATQDNEEQAGQDYEGPFNWDETYHINIMSMSPQAILALRSNRNFPVSTSRQELSDVVPVIPGQEGSANVLALSCRAYVRACEWKKIFAAK